MKKIIKKYLETEKNRYKTWGVRVVNPLRVSSSPPTLLSPHRYSEGSRGSPRTNRTCRKLQRVSGRKLT